MPIYAYAYAAVEKIAIIIINLWVFVAFEYS